VLVDHGHDRDLGAEQPLDDLVRGVDEAAERVHGEQDGRRGIRLRVAHGTVDVVGERRIDHAIDRDTVHRAVAKLGRGLRTRAANGRQQHEREEYGGRAESHGGGV